MRVHQTVVWMLHIIHRSQGYIPSGYMYLDDESKYNYVVNIKVE